MNWTILNRIIIPEFDDEFQYQVWIQLLMNEQQWNQNDHCLTYGE